MTEPSPELVEEIKQVISKAESDFMHPYDFAKSGDECVTFIARAVLSSPSIARALANKTQDSPPRTYQHSSDLADNLGSGLVVTEGKTPRALSLHNPSKNEGIMKSTPQATGLSAIAQTRDEAAGYEAAAQVVENLKMGEILLAMGELTAQEKRTCKALLGFAAHRVRKASPPIERSEIGEAPVE